MRSAQPRPATRTSEVYSLWACGSRQYGARPMDGSVKVEETPTLRRHAAARDAQHRAAGDVPGADPEQQHPDVRLVGAGGADDRAARHAHVGQPADHHAASRRHAVGLPGLDADDAPRPQVRLPHRLADGHGRRFLRRHRARHGQLPGDVPGRPAAGLRRRQHATLPLRRRRAGAGRRSAPRRSPMSLRAA